MSIVYQHDKRSGITYAYESTAYWDKKKKQSRAKRRLIGRVDKDSGNIIPTRSVNKKAEDGVAISKRGRPAMTETSRAFYGATYLLDEIGRKLGLEADLKECFPETWQMIISAAYYLLLEPDSSLSRFSKWASLHCHPYGKEITSQRFSELFAAIKEADRCRFFTLQGSRRCEHEYWAYDVTSISSYSECLKQVRYGMNKEDDHLPQINMALIFGQESGLPFYYRTLPGNITDLKTVGNMLADLEFLQLKKVHLVMDRGFYSAENINGLYKGHYKFLMGAKLSLKMVNEQLDKHRVTLRDWTRYSEEHDVFAQCIPVTWEYEQERPYKRDVVKEDRRMYMHLYFNAERAAEEEVRFSKKLLLLQKELQQGRRQEKHAALYERFFEVYETPVRGIQVMPRQDVINAAKKNYGYFVLLSNEIKNPVQALTMYRNKDMVEKAFGNLKERLNMRRMQVSSEQSLEGKMFVQFVALIYLSAIKKALRDAKLSSTITLQEVLDQLDVIECFNRTGKTMRIGEMTTKQIELYQQLGCTPPASL